MASLKKFHLELNATEIKCIKRKLSKTEFTVYLKFNFDIRIIHPIIVT